MNRPNQRTIVVRRPGATLTRWNDAEQLQRQVDDAFAGIFGYTPLARLIPGGQNEFHFSPDLYETEEELVLVAPFPGLDPENLHIEATEEALTLKGERKPFYQNEKAKQIRNGGWTSAHGEFQFTYSLPILINPDAVQAHYRHGVLELHLPKAEAVKPKTIKVNVNAE